jgi:DNA polymerase-4/DNA polymerase V
LITAEKSRYRSIQKMKTFIPPSRDRAFVFSHLSKNLENACIKARKYKLAAKGAFIVLKTQAFRMQWMEVKFSCPTAFPQEIVRAIEPVFMQFFQEGEDYRATGIVLTKRQEDVRVVRHEVALNRVVD